MRISEIYASEQAVIRRYRQARSEYETYFGVLMLEGSQIGRAGRQDRHAAPGILRSTMRPGLTTCSSASRGARSSSAFPRDPEPARHRDGAPHGLPDANRGGRRHHACVSRADVVADPQRDRGRDAALSDTAISLIAMTLGGMQRNDLAQSRMKALTLTRVKRHLVEHPHDPELAR